MSLPPFSSAPSLNGSGSLEPRPAAWPTQSPVIPNLGGWAPGDVLVMKARKPGTHVVKVAQNLHPCPKVKSNSDWVHCAIYLGNGLIADARPRKVVGVRRLSTEAGHREIEVLRFDPAVVPPKQLALFLDRCYELEGVPYSSLPGWIKLFLNVPTTTSAQGVVCSSMIELVARNAGVFLAGPSSVVGPIAPASFLNHPWLTPVFTEWRLPR